MSYKSYLKELNELDIQISNSKELDINLIQQRNELEFKRNKQDINFR